MPVTTEIAVLSDFAPTEFEFRIHFLQAIPKDVKSIKEVKGTILFCHGFPQTAHQFRLVLQPIADQTGYLCIAPDMRGHGYSSKPLDGPEGFTKSKISQDFHDVIFKHLGLGDKPIHVVGHDVGAMVAVRYAMQFPETKSLVFGEAPVPGTAAYAGAWQSTNTHLWHWAQVFQSVPNLPEALIAGKEKIFLAHFYHEYAYNVGPVAQELDYYATQYSMYGALRCAFNTYRAFKYDNEENIAWLKEHQKLTLPTTVVSGERCFLATVADSMGAEICTDFKTAVVAGSGHWLAEENPESFVEAIVTHVQGVDTGRSSLK